MLYFLYEQTDTDFETDILSHNTNYSIGYYIYINIDKCMRHSIAKLQ